MNKWLVISGGVCIFLGIVAAIIGLASSMNFEAEENILHNTKTDGSTFEYDGDTIIVAVYAVGDVGCTDFEVTIIASSYMNRSNSDFSILIPILNMLVPGNQTFR